MKSIGFLCFQFALFSALCFGVVFDDVGYYKTLLAVSFAFSLFVSVSYQGVLSLYFIFLICYFFFGLSKVLIGGDIYKAILISGDYSFLPGTINYSLFINVFFIMLINFFYILMYRPIKRLDVCFDINLYRIGLLLFYICLPVVIYKFYSEIRAVASIGYYNFYVQGSGLSFWVSITRPLFELGFVLILVSRPNRNVFIKYSMFFLAIMSLSFFVGLRSKFMLYFLTIIWLYYVLYSVQRPNIFYIIAAALMCVFLLLLVQYYRQGWIMNLPDGMGLLQYFITSQSVNFFSLPMVIESEFIQNNFSFWAPLNVNALFFSGNYYKFEIGLLGDLISYVYLGQDLYSEGHGIGSSFLAELYLLPLLGGVGVILVLSFFLARIESCIARNRIYVVLGFYLAPTIFYMMRGSILKGFLYLTASFVIVMFIMLCLNLINKNK